jgi:hypothetical protein
MPTRELRKQCGKPLIFIENKEKDVMNIFEMYKYKYIIDKHFIIQ